MRKKEIEKRLAEIKAIAENPKDTDDLKALLEERNKLITELNQIEEEERSREELRAQIANGLGTTIEAVTQVGQKAKTNDEIRSSTEYVNAYAHYIKTKDPTECRSLLTENVSAGEIPVPTILDEKIRTAWERDEILSRVSRSAIRGNLRVPFELSATDAVVHEEGGEAIAEEELHLGIVTLIAESVKKYISLSDEVIDMGGQPFLDYIYDELTYRIARKLAELCITDIIESPATSTKIAIGVPAVSMAPGVTTLPTAAANLSDEATEIVVVMNRLTEVEFLAAYAAGNFAVDPFAGLTKVYTSALPAYSAARSGDAYAIVGDLKAVRVNFPAGDGIVLKYDELSQMTADIAKVLGRQYAAHGVVEPGRLVKVTKP